MFYQFKHTIQLILILSGTASGDCYFCNGSQNLTFTFEHLNACDNIFVVAFVASTINDENHD
jgi:hypothetical protein